MIKFNKDSIFCSFVLKFWKLCLRMQAKKIICIVVFTTIANFQNIYCCHCDAASRLCKNCASQRTEKQKCNMNSDCSSVCSCSSGKCGITCGGYGTVNASCTATFSDCINSCKCSNKKCSLGCSSRFCVHRSNCLGNSFCWNFGCSNAKSSKYCIDNDECPTGQCVPSGFLKSCTYGSSIYCLSDAACITNTTMSMTNLPTTITATTRTSTTTTNIITTATSINTTTTANDITTTNTEATTDTTALSTSTNLDMSSTTPLQITTTAISTTIIHTTTAIETLPITEISTTSNNVLSPISGYKHDRIKFSNFSK